DQQEDRRGLEGVKHTPGDGRDRSPVGTRRNADRTPLTRRRDDNLWLLNWVTVTVAHGAPYSVNLPPAAQVDGGKVRCRQVIATVTLRKPAEFTPVKTAFVLSR